MTQHMIFRGTDLGEFDPNEVTMNEAMLLEDRTGFTIADLQEAGKMSGRLTQALIWFMRVRAGDTAAELHVDFKFGDIKSEEFPDEDPTQATEEVAELEKTLAKSGSSTSGS